VAEVFVTAIARWPCFHNAGNVPFEFACNSGGTCGGVEDNLNALHNLETEARQQHDATDSAQQSLDLFHARYEDGADTYLQVITWQTALFQNQRNDIEIMQRRFEASVLLVKALGGGWDASQLPQRL
jgi:outer membrane protein TolC